MKICCTCKLEKNENEFWKDKKSEDGLCNYCIQCYRDKHGSKTRKFLTEDERKTAKLISSNRWRDENRDRVNYLTRKRRLKNSYNINERRRENHIKNKESINAKKKEWRQNHKEQYAVQQRKDSLKRNYGLSLEQFEQMKYDQDNRCAICKKEFTDEYKKGCACVDHNHFSGAIRQLLCIKCNNAIGLFDEDINIIESAIKYLNFHSNMQLQGSSR